MQILQGMYVMEVESFKFSGGELSVRLLDDLTRGGDVTINTHLRNSDDVMQLLLVNDAIRRSIGKLGNIKAVIPYIPYGRQDRVCNEGEAFGLRVMCDLINSCNFESVLITDPHSDVTPALINNCQVYSAANVFIDDWTQKFIKRDYKGCAIVSPDAGANKKVQTLCKKMNIDSYIRADKVRELSTGKITDTIVFCEDLKGQDCMIVDDICDGGYTFIKLAEELKKKNAGKVGLYVTHGIFSKGKKVFDGLIDGVYSHIDWTENK